MRTRIVAFSDTHGSHRDVRVPDGDVLVFAGDACNYGTLPELYDFAVWWRGLPHRHKVFVAGNHDWPFERDKAAAIHLLGHGTHYLEDDEVTVAGIRIYGSPWTPEFCGWAFNLPRDGSALARRWANIPSGVDLLVTHGPATEGCGVMPSGTDLGDPWLRDALARAAPRFHLSGHIHNGARDSVVGEAMCRNVSVLDDSYLVCRGPLVLELEGRDDG